VEASCRVDVDVEVRYAETDRMGVVHHSVYPVWFEVARTRLCIETGYHYAAIEDLGYLLVVTGVGTRFLAPAGYGDTVQVGCWLDRMASRILRFGYEVSRAETVLATGSTEHVWVRRETQRPCRIPSILKEPFSRLLVQGPVTSGDSRR
jgi:acyl-CoA thioester hydrolase